jgi:hypothetical protein
VRRWPAVRPAIVRPPAGPVSCGTPTAGAVRHAACRFYYTGQKFTDRAYGEDAREKYFGGDKPELAKKNPCINLPYLIDGDRVVTQSNSILLHLGRKLGIDKDEYFIHNHQVRTVFFAGS